MLSILNKILSLYKFNLDSKVSDITDTLDYIVFIIECEEYYNYVIKDDEAIFFEEENLSFQQIDDFFTFLKGGETTPFIHRLITKNINRLKENRPEYESYIIDCRDRKIKKLGL